MTSTKFGPPVPVSWSPDYKSSRRDELLRWAREVGDPGTGLLAASSLDPESDFIDPDDDVPSGNFDVSQLTYHVIREHVSEYYNRAATEVIGRFSTAAEAVEAARAAVGQRSRITIQVVGWEALDDA